MKDEAKTKLQLIIELKKLNKKIEFLEYIINNENIYQSIFENIQDIYYRADNRGDITIINPHGAKILGYNAPEEVIGKNLGDDFYLNPEQRKENIDKVRKSGGMIKDLEVQLRKKDGTPITVTTTSHFLYDNEGEIIGIEGLLVDVTEKREMEKALRKSQQEFASIFKSNPEATVYTDENGIILNINTRFSKLFGYTLQESIGKNIDEGFIQPPDKIEESKQLTRKGLKENYIGFETIRMKKDGTPIPVYVSASPVIIDGKRKGVIGTYYDMTERKKAEKQLKKLARVDTLTDCYNRSYGLELVERQLKLCHRNKRPLLIAFLDLDNFKIINDTLGHNEGDKILEQIGCLLKSSLREIDIICRMGGDEFLLAFPETSLKAAPLIKRRMKKKLSQLNKSLHLNYKIDFTIGFSEYTCESLESLDELITEADIKMYEDKKRKKANHHY